MHELYEELDAFDPRWRNRYATVYLAFLAAELPYEIWHSFKQSTDGRNYTHTMTGVPQVLIEYSSLIPGAMIEEETDDER